MSLLLYYLQVIVVYKTSQTHVVAHLEVTYCQSFYYTVICFCRVFVRVIRLRNLKVATYCSNVVFKGGCGRRIVSVVCGTKVAVEHVVDLVLDSSIFFSNLSLYINHLIIAPSRSLALAKLIVGCQLCKQSYMINRIGYRNLGSRVGDGYNGKCLIANPPIIIIVVIRFVRIVGKHHLVESVGAFLVHLHSCVITREFVALKLRNEIVNRIVAHKEVESVVAHSALVFRRCYALKRGIHPVEVVLLLFGRKSVKSSYLHNSIWISTEVVAQLCNRYIERQVA